MMMIVWWENKNLNEKNLKNDKKVKTEKDKKWCAFQNVKLFEFFYYYAFIFSFQNTCLSIQYRQVLFTFGFLQ